MTSGQSLISFFFHADETSKREGTDNAETIQRFERPEKTNRYEKNGQYYKGIALINTENIASWNQTFTLSK